MARKYQYYSAKSLSGGKTQIRGHSSLAKRRAATKGQGVRAVSACSPIVLKAKRQRKRSGRSGALGSVTVANVGRRGGRRRKKR